MKSLIFNILSFLTFFIPIKFLIKLTVKRIIYPFYHIVSNNNPLHIKYLYRVRTEKQFRKDLDFLTKYYKSSINIGKEPNTNQHLFHLSFDDGLSECYDIIAPILKEYKIKATFFLNSAFIDNKDLFYKYKASIILDEIHKNDLSENQKLEIGKILLSKRVLNIKQIIKYIINIKYSKRHYLDKIADILNINFEEYLKKHKPYLTKHEVKELISDGHQIGAHSIDHPLYSHLNEEEQIRQTSESLKFIETEFDITNKLFAFPFTDDKIKTSFFNELNNKNIANYTFGTAGIKDDIIKINIQRIPIEKRKISAKRYIKTEYLMYFIKKIIGKHTVKRKT